MAKTILESPEVGALASLVEESVRSSSEGVKYFIEPAQGVLLRAKNKRHQIVFGRRGSGKSSLLQKLYADASVDRRPVAYVDLEEFKGHSYPDVLVSILIKTLSEFNNWIDTAGINPANKVSFWNRLFGRAPSQPPLNRAKAKELHSSINLIIIELKDVLMSADEAKEIQTDKSGNSSEAALSASGKIDGGPVSANSEAKYSGKTTSDFEIKSEYTSKKIEILRRKIIDFKEVFRKIGEISNGPSYILLDDLYHIRRGDQPQVIDYFHSLAKGSNVWMKVGTVKHRSRWYVYGDPPLGVKLGDDAEEIDLDVTLEKYDLTKRFLLSILEQFAKQHKLKIDTVMTDGARDRLVLASGGVARDFLTIFRRSIDVARERIARGDTFRGERISAEDVNKAAGENDRFKREEFSRDTGLESSKLMEYFRRIADFCTDRIKANCILIDKDFSGDDVLIVGELVDLKFLHHINSRITVRDRRSRLYDAYMLDLSQYAGERARRDFEIIEFWGNSGDEELRRSKLIYLERDKSAS